MNSTPAAAGILQVLFYGAPTIIILVVFLGGISFAISRIRKYPKPAARLAIGLTLLFTGRIAGIVGSAFLSRSMGPQDFVGYHGILSIFLSLSSLVGWIFIINAVFVARSDTGHGVVRSGNSEGKIDRSGQDANPYSTPSSV